MNEKAQHFFLQMFWWRTPLSALNQLTRPVPRIEGKKNWRRCLNNLREGASFAFEGRPRPPSPLVAYRRPSAWVRRNGQASQQQSLFINKSRHSRTLATEIVMHIHVLGRGLTERIIKNWESITCSWPSADDDRPLFLIRFLGVFPSSTQMDAMGHVRRHRSCNGPPNYITGAPESNLGLIFQVSISVADSLRGSLPAVRRCRPNNGKNDQKWNRFTGRLPGHLISKAKQTGSFNFIATSRQADADGSFFRRQHFNWWIIGSRRPKNDQSRDSPSMAKASMCTSRVETTSVNPKKLTILRRWFISVRRRFKCCTCGGKRTCPLVGPFPLKQLESLRPRWVPRRPRHKPNISEPTKNTRR